MIIDQINLQYSSVLHVSESEISYRWNRNILLDSLLFSETVINYSIECKLVLHNKILSDDMRQAEKPVSTSFSTSHEMSTHAAAGRPSASNVARSPSSTASIRARSLCAPASGIPDLLARILKLLLSPSHTRNFVRAKLVIP